MHEPTVVHSTFVIERTYPVAPGQVFAAFADEKKKRLWYAVAKTHDVEEFVMDFRIGGVDRSRYRMRENTPFPGVQLTNLITYQDIVPDRRLVFVYTMSLAERRFSSSLVTIELLPSQQGTDLIFTEQGAYFEGADGPAMRQEGWKQLLDSLQRELTSWNSAGDFD